MCVYSVYNQSIAITLYDEYPISIIVALFIRPSKAQDNLYNLSLIHLFYLESLINNATIIEIGY